MEKEKTLSKIIDNLNYLVYIVDPESKKILYANQILKEIFGDDIEGKKCYKVFQNLNAPCEFCPEKYILKTGKTYVWEFQNKRNGRWYYCIDNLVLWEGKLAHMEIAIDITERIEREKKILEELERMEKLIADISEISTLILETRDPYTATHGRKVAELSVSICQNIILDQEEQRWIYCTALLHDIGKIAVPLEILNKPGQLSEFEFNLIKQHPITGYNILRNIRFPFPVAEVILQHHERINGSGYPYGLKGDKILLETKILSVADVVEAMTSPRPYRPALGIDKALEEIDKNRGILYDEKVVEICLDLFLKKGFKFSE